MIWRYIVLVGGDGRQQAHAEQNVLLHGLGLECRFSQGAARLFVSRETPTLSIPGHGVVIGQLFTADGQPVTTAQLSTQIRDVAELEKYLLDNYWGEYILLLASGTDGHLVRILRDPSGGIPCVFSIHGETGFITSSISLAVRLNLYRKEIDWEYISHGLTFPYLRTMSTGFSEISELLPGCSLHVDEISATTHSTWSPWKFVAPEHRQTDADEAAASVRRSVATAVKSWAEADGDILLELSGGLDSSIVAACLRGVNARTTCCTVVTPLPGENEQRYAEQMAAVIGVKLHSLETSFEDARFDFAPPEDSTVPGMGILHVVTDDVMAKAGDMHGVSSFFSGAGGDTIFCYLRGTAPAVDAYKERGVSAGLAAIRNLSVLHQCTPWKAGRLALKKLLQSPKDPWKIDNSFLMPSVVPDTFESHPWFVGPMDALPGDRQKIVDLVGTQTYRDGMPRGSRKHVRIPLLSQPVMEACLKVPTWMCISDGENRSVARAAFSDVLPRDILRRKSKGSYLNYSGAVYKQNSLKIRDYLLEGQLRSQNMIDPVSLEKFFRREPAPRDYSFLRIFHLCMTENWLRHQI